MNKDSVQPALRNLMEDYSNSVRFIFTCNYPHRIITPVKSRCQEVKIERTDLTEFTARVATILVEEGIEFDLDTLDTFVQGTYPDLRKCINNVQMHSTNGTLKVPEVVDGAGDYRVEMVDLFKKGKISEARKLLCSQARPEEMEEIYRWMYDNVVVFGDSEEKQDSAILIIKQGLVDNASVADQEINLAATLIRLARLQ
jgi:DNA polymerase III delta prime subunit